MASLNVAQLRKLVKNPDIRKAISEGDGIDMAKLLDIKSMSDAECDGICKHADFWLKNYGNTIATFSSQYDFEINPIQVNGIRGLYSVEVMGEEPVYFDTKRAALTHAGSRIGNFYIEDGDVVQ
jgi:hypothetical protein